MANCSTTSNNKIFTFTEQRSKLVLNNKDQILSTSIHVDGCAINDNGIRCDYLHLAKQLEIYIELKGQDIEHAMKQLERTITLLGAGNKQQKRICYIICTRSPLASTQIQQYDRHFRNKYNAKLVVKSSPYTDSY